MLKYFKKNKKDGSFGKDVKQIVGACSEKIGDYTQDDRLFPIRYERSIHIFIRDILLVFFEQSELKKNAVKHGFIKQ